MGSDYCAVAEQWLRCYLISRAIPHHLSAGYYCPGFVSVFPARFGPRGPAVELVFGFHLCVVQQRAAPDAPVHGLPFACVADPSFLVLLVSTRDLPWRE